MQWRYGHLSPHTHWKITVIQNGIDLTWMVKVPLTEPLNYSTEEWELVHLFEMKYNRMVIFNAAVIHKIFFEPGVTNFSHNIEGVRLALNTWYKYIS